MGHGISWFNYLPGYEAFAHYIDSQSEGILFGKPALVQHVLAAGLVTLILLLLSLKARSELKAAGDGAVIPSPGVSLRNMLELVLEALYKQARNIIGEEAPRYFPVIGTLALFIFFSNVLGLIPGFVPPTDNWNTTMACGGFVFVYYNFHGLRAQGMGHIVHMANPVGEWWGWFLSPLLFPIEIVSHCARPFTLGVRLAANMTGDHAVLAALLGLVPVIVPFIPLTLGLLVCVIQTVVFVLLTMIYIGLAVAHAHDDEHGHGHEHGAEAKAH